MKIINCKQANNPPDLFTVENVFSNVYTVNEIIERTAAGLPTPQPSSYEAMDFNNWVEDEYERKEVNTHEYDLKKEKELIENLNTEEDVTTDRTTGIPETEPNQSRTPGANEQTTVENSQISLHE